MFTRILLAVPVTTAAVAAWAANGKQDNTQQEVKVVERRRKIYARGEQNDDVMDLKKHQRPPLGHHALNSGFAVEMSSW